MEATHIDAKTLACYETQAATIGERYRAAEGGISRWFGEAFSGLTKILDIGCGAGCDVCRLLSLGHDAIGVDASPAMLAVAAETCRTQGIDPGARLVHDSLPDLASFADNAFDGILCSAVLMHLPEERLFDSVYGMRRVLRPGGRLLLSIPLDRPQIDPETRRDRDGRYFAELAPAKIKLLMERVGFRLLWDRDGADSLNRPGYTWLTFLFERNREDVERPLDQVESILNRDKKDATYKLALFRVLADIAQTQYNLAHYERNGQVGIPIQALAERWMVYYWPLIASETFIPQKYGETPGSSKPVAVRQPLKAIIDGFDEGGGLPAFMVALKNGNLPVSVKRAYQQAIRKIGDTIWNMPVRYAGGGADFSVFQYDRANRRVIMSESMWRELTLTGSWILDATILRWAELTVRLSKGAIPISSMIEKLLSISDPVRETCDARKIYIKIGVTECVWSKRRLQADRFDVDHVIPFTLWRNNDLWNLLPAHPAVNNAKRDSLPSQSLLRRRRDNIIGCWEALRGNFSERFDREAAVLCGSGHWRRADWQATLFSRLSEAVEITAIQRCVPRWEPAPDAFRPRSSASRTAPKANIRMTGARPDPDRPVSPSIGRLPLVAALAAGPFFDGFSAGRLSTNEETEWVDVPAGLCGPQRFVVRVAGRSMEPLFAVGDLLVFEYHRTPRTDGQIVIAADFTDGVEAGGYAIKRYRAHSDQWLFVSENPDYPAVQIPKKEMQYPILGIFVAKLVG